MGSTISPSSSQLQLHQLQQQQHQQQQLHHQLSSATPSTSSGGTMRAQASSVLNFASSSGMSLSQQSLSPESAHDTDGPLSPTGPGGSTSGGAGSKFPRSDSQRRTGHIHAEQKRRYNIKNGFDTLHSLIPQLQQNPNAKVRPYRTSLQSRVVVGARNRTYSISIPCSESYPGPIRMLESM